MWAQHAMLRNIYEEALGSRFSPRSPRCLIFAGARRPPNRSAFTQFRPVGRATSADTVIILRPALCDPETPIQPPEIGVA